MGEEKVAAEVFVSGRVHGVGYRFFMEAAALELDLKGYCRNLTDGRVQIEVEGNRKELEELIKRAWEGPIGAQVTDVQVSFSPAQGKFMVFTIRY